MIDYSELRRKAEAATPGEWVVREGTYAVHQPEFQCWIPQNLDDAAYIAAANPVVILALLDELDAAKRNIELKDRALANMLQQSDKDIATIAELKGRIAAIGERP